jgi:hypothetical protein
MGPCLGLTFGTRVQDWPLVWSSILNETLALIGCVVIGLLVGICAGFTDLAYDTWPTNEMHSRGEVTGLLTGIAIAIPSGMGVCLSILGGNTSSLVGVAISASLLPPAVNAGVCFMHSILLTTDAVSSLSGRSAEEIAEIGAISFALTVLNIICIWVAGIIMFEIKEVAPTESKGAFWARDIKVARKMNSKGKTGEKPLVDASVIRAGLKTALAKKKGEKVEAVRIRPPGKRKPRTSNYGQVDSAFAFQPKPRRTPIYQRSNLWEADAEETEVVDENVRYVGLEDMAALLFDENDEDDVLRYL